MYTERRFGYALFSWVLSKLLDINLLTTTSLCFVRKIIVKLTKNIPELTFRKSPVYSAKEPVQIMEIMYRVHVTKVAQT